MLFRHICQHIFDKNTVAHGGVVDKDMGDCADELAVLDNGGAGHSLNDAPGGAEHLTAAIQHNSRLHINTLLLFL